MKLRRRLKQESRRALSRAWPKCIMLTAVYLMISAVCTMAEEWIGTLLRVRYFEDRIHTPRNFLDDVPRISPAVLLLFAGGLLVSFVLSAPLRLGLKRWYLHLVAQDPKPLSYAFGYYVGPSVYLRAILFEAQLFLRRSVLVIICFFPVVLFHLSLPFWERIGIPKLLFSFLSALMLGIFCLVASMLCLLWIGRSFLAEYLYVLYPCKMRDAFYLSAQIMRGRKTTLFSLKLSFLPLDLLGLLILPRLWTISRKEVAFARYAQHFMESYEKEKERATDQNEQPQTERFLTKEFLCPS